MNTTLDRAVVREIAVDMMEALKAVALKHGIEFSYKGGSFFPSNATYRFEAALVGASGVAETRERKDYTLYAKSYNLKAEWLDKIFVHDTDTFTIIGLSTRKRKNPVLCKNSRNDKTYVFPAYMVKMLMESQNKAAVTA